MLVLLDRDGVINVDTPTGVLTVAEFQFIPGALEAIARLTRAGITLAICTNQSAIGKGWMDEETLASIHAYMLGEIERTGGRIASIYIAPEHPDAPSTRRKPAPGMLFEAIAEFEVAPSGTFFIGDALRDLEAAHAAGCQRLLVRTGKGADLERAGIPPSLMPVHICDDLAAAADYLLAVASASN